MVNMKATANGVFYEGKYYAMGDRIPDVDDAHARILELSGKAKPVHAAKPQTAVGKPVAAMARDVAVVRTTDMSTPDRLSKK